MPSTMFEATTGNVIMKVVKIGAQLESPNQMMEMTIQTKTDVELRTESTSWTTSREERGQAEQHGDGDRAAEPDGDPVERRRGVPPDLAAGENLDEAAQDREGRGEDVRAVTEGECRPRRQHDRRDAERRQVKAARPATLDRRTRGGCGPDSPRCPTSRSRTPC